MNKELSINQLCIQLSSIDGIHNIKSKINNMNIDEKLSFLNTYSKLNIHCAQNPEAKWVLEDPVETWSVNLPKSTYTYNPKQNNTSIHWGQRKLLLTEVDFLTQFKKDNPKQNNYTFIYAGGAPGIHTPYLSDLFPEFNFILIDPSPFNIEENNKIKLINDYFTDDMAHKFSESYDNIIFCSDIRSFGNKTCQIEKQKCVDNDNISQLKWHHILNSKKSILKFRIPYNFNLKNINKFSNNYKYADGIVRFQPFARQRSGESRLWLDNKETYTFYNDVIYENVYQYFNEYTRANCYICDPKLKNIPGFDYCYDCVREYNIWEEYCKTFNKDNPIDIIKHINCQPELNYHNIKIQYSNKNYKIDFYDYRFGLYKDIYKLIDFAKNKTYFKYKKDY